MDELLRRHLRIFKWLLICVGVYTAVAIFSDHFFATSIPAEILLILLSVCLASDISQRVLFWSKRGDFLTSYEISSRRAKAFLAAIPAEIFLVFLFIYAMFE